MKNRLARRGIAGTHFPFPRQDGRAHGRESGRRCQYHRVSERRVETRRVERKRMTCPDMKNLHTIFQSTTTERKKYSTESNEKVFCVCAVCVGIPTFHSSGTHSNKREMLNRHILLQLFLWDGICAIRYILILGKNKRVGLFSLYRLPFSQVERITHKVLL